MHKQLRQKREEGGFTLIELLIVIIILGILAAIVVFAVGSTRKDSVTSSCKTDAKSIELSIEAVNTKTGSYPANQAAVVAPGEGALLKAWPDSDDYTFTYAFTAATSGATPTPAGYTVTIAGSNVTGGTFTNVNNSGIDTGCKGT